VSISPLVFWIVVVVFALGWLLLVGLVIKLTKKVDTVDSDVGAIDRDLAKNEKAVHALKVALDVVQRAQAAQTNPMMPVVRPDVPPGRHSRFRTPPPTPPYA
jgi:hypothetical protein